MERQHLNWIYCCNLVPLICPPHLVQNLIMISWCSLTLAKKCNSNEFSHWPEITLLFCTFIDTYTRNDCPSQKCQRSIFYIFSTLLRTWSNFLRSNISAQQILILVFLSAFLRYLSDSVHWKEKVWNCWQEQLDK